MAANAGSDKPAGISLYHYRANRSMERVFFNADGEWLIVPQLGRLRIATEPGRLELAPLEIAVLPRALKFRVELLSPQARGYLPHHHCPPSPLPPPWPTGPPGLATPPAFPTPLLPSQ